MLAISVPIDTRAPDTNPLPVTVIVVPPAFGPLAGETPVTVSDEDGGGVDDGFVEETWAEGVLTCPEVL